MHNYVVVEVPNDLLPQVVGELLQFAADPNLVDVVHEASGRVIHAHPEVADAWYRSRQKVEEKAPETPVTKAPTTDTAPPSTTGSTQRETPKAPTPVAPVKSASPVPKKTTSA